MGFRVLGPLEACGADGQPLPLGPVPARILAALLLAVNQVVDWSRLIDLVWDERPPATARRQIQNSVSLLRRQLTAAGAPGQITVVRRIGYRVGVRDDQLDAEVFQRLIDQARRAVADGLTARAADQLTEALALWRGPALAGLAGGALRAAAARLDEQRLAATELRFDLQLGLGRHREVIGELTESVAANPLRERLVGHLMRALHASGRQADALAAYRDLRRRLADELGIDPSGEIQQLHTAILRNQPLGPGDQPARKETPAEVEYRVLGPVEAVRAGRPVQLAAPRQRALLAVLLLEANRVVSMDRLIEELWGERPPAQARNTIQSLVLRLRRALTQADDVLVTRQPGYLLRVAPGRLDLARFEDLMAKGQAALAAGQPEPAARHFREALALWRGEPLADVAGAGLTEVAAPRLRERRLQATEGRIEADLLLGRHGDLIVELPALIAEQPLRERLYGLLMLALSRAGRQAEALEVFHTARRRLADEIGVEPGAGLRDIHRAILRGEVDQAPSVASPPRHRPPAQLPLDVLGFVGRDGELAQLDAILAGAGTATAAVLVSALSGTAGVGKTALAVHWAHRVADRFPDGQLYVNLRGFDHSAAGARPAEAVRGFLDAFAVPPQRIPDGPDAQVALYRSMLAGRRVLVLLDNARDAEQVRPLLPGASGCLALVTSRNPLSGLVAAEGARPVVLDLLSAAESRDLLAGRIGADRLAVEPAAADEIVARCARLPLALAIVAARAAVHPGFALARLAVELRAARGRLDPFAGDDPATDVRAVFSWSYHTLGPAAARLFRLLGLHPGPDISTAAAASLAGVPPGQVVTSALAELTRVQLLTEHTPGRFTFHDLLRAYASELTDRMDDADDRRLATHRLLDHHLHSAHTASRLLLHPHLEPIALPPPRPGVTPERPADDHAALAWFAAEHDVLQAAVWHAAAAGFDVHCWQLAWTLIAPLNRSGQWRLEADLLHAGLAAARRCGDLAGQAQCCRGLGGTYAQLARYDDARDQLGQALDLFRRIADHNGQASARFGLGMMYGRQGRHQEALDCAQHALDLYRTAGHRAGQASALNTIGWYHAQLGDHRLALACCEEAVALHAESGDRHGEAITWDSLGYTHHQLGDHQRAVTCYRRSLALLHGLGDRYPEAETLVHLGDAQRDLGDAGAARAAWQDALEVLDQLDHPDADQVRARLHLLDQPP